MYYCDQCDYKDKRKGKLKMHKESIHKKLLTLVINVNTRQSGKNTYQGTLSLYMEKPVINVNIKQNVKDSWKIH
jgi:hypothetical protein